MGYARPTQLSQALSLLSDGEWTVLAGGTDIYPATDAQVLRGNILDISAIDGLRGIIETTDHWRLGARTTWSDIRKANLPHAFRALRLAAAEVGGIQIQNAGTIAGNLCNASPAADGVPALMILDAEVEVSSLNGRRALPLADFLTGPRQTTLRPGEMVTAVLVPKHAVSGVSAFRKLGARTYLVISIAMVAVRLKIECGLIAEVAVSVGACSGIAVRMRSVETALIGMSTSDAVQRIDAAQVATSLSPIDDVRASADYRAEAAAELIRRAIADLETAA